MKVTTYYNLKKTIVGLISMLFNIHYMMSYVCTTVAKYDALIRTCQYFIVYLVFVFIIQSIINNTVPGASGGASGATFSGPFLGKLRSHV